MAFKKNNTAGKGRPLNSKNKNTAEIKELIRNVVGKELDQVEKLLGKLEPKDRLDIIVKLLPYVAPRQAEISIEANPGTFEPLTVTLIEPNGKD